MKVRPTAALLRRAFGPAYGLLVAASIGLSVFSAVPPIVGVPLAVGSATLASLLRGLVPRHYRFFGLLPPIVALGILASYCPLGTIPELAAGLAGLALLLWCSEDPDRDPGALGRGLAGVVVPATVLALAWVSSLLLPSGVGSLGIAAALLVACVVGVGLLLGAPRVFDRDPSATS